MANYRHYNDDTTMVSAGIGHVVDIQCDDSVEKSVVVVYENIIIIIKKMMIDEMMMDEMWTMITE